MSVFGVFYNENKNIQQTNSLCLVHLLTEFPILIMTSFTHPMPYK